MIRPSASILTTPVTSRAMSSVRSGAGSIGVGGRTQHFRNAVDDQARAVASGSNNDKPAPIALFEAGHVETLALIHNREPRRRGD